MKFVCMMILSSMAAAVSAENLEPKFASANKNLDEKARLAAGNQATKLRALGGAGPDGQPRRRKLTSKDKDKNKEKEVDACEDFICFFEKYYYYQPFSGDGYWNGFHIDKQDGCVLAAINDEKSRRGAQYAIPDGKIAITQGYFPLEDYFHCDFDDAKSDDGVVHDCPHPGYNDMFINFDGTHVIDDDDCWVHFDTIADGAIYAGIGSDGLLRPVQSWNAPTTEDSELAYDGFVYECCPFIQDVCGATLLFGEGPYTTAEEFATITAGLALFLNL